MTHCPTQRLSSILPPLIFGCATFNNLYNKDPYALDTAGLVREALELGVRAFDTSPYYGPSEELLGRALDTDFVRSKLSRSDYFILTKCGRISADDFDYSPEWIRQSVQRSLARLRTDYLDVVYCHDVEFVTDDEVVLAVKELRRIRDETGSIKYIGISGYPLPVLCRLAKRIKDETGEPLDAVMSYANYTLQNTLLAQDSLKELTAAGVDVVPNASMLGMGLLRRDGVPVGARGDWHPSGTLLRSAIRRASDFCDRHGERLEVIAIRYALESWITLGEPVGSRGDPASGLPWTVESNLQVGGRKLGVSLMGVSNIEELHKTLQVWRSILDGLENGHELALKAGRWKRDHEWSLNRKHAVQIMADGIQEHMAEWLDTPWASPPPGYVQITKAVGNDGEATKVEGMADMLTPAASPTVEGQVPLSQASHLPLR